MSAIYLAVKLIVLFMNLIIDSGNTKVKMAVFHKSQIQCLKSCAKNDIEALFSELKAIYKTFDKAIVSSVSAFEFKTWSALASIPEILFLTHKTPLPFVNCYQTPSTLGVDRMALASAAIMLYPKSNVLVIDAGTCITYDFVNANQEYVGGGISPGLNVRYKSLHELTAKLPLLKPKIPVSLIGNTTESSIHSGVVYGIINEIDGIIETYKEKNEDLTVILTGGDSKFLSKQLKNSIFANSNFLLEGLNYILEFNTKYD